MCVMSAPVVFLHGSGCTRIPIVAKDAYDRIIAIPTDFTSFMLASCFGNLAFAKQLLNESNLDATDSRLDIFVLGYKKW